MIPASRLGGLNHVAGPDPNAESAPTDMSASGQSGKHFLDQSITEFGPEADVGACEHRRLEGGAARL